MSQGTKIPRDEAMAMARVLLGHLSNVCERVEIAGSLRRGCPEVGDIEICCIPVQVTNLLCEPTYDWAEVRDALSMFPMLKGGDHYQQYDLGRCKADIFVTSREQWGVIFAIRTGSADFSHKLVTPKAWGGFMPGGRGIGDGRLWRWGMSVATPEETDLFREMGLPWIHPEKR